MQRIVILGNAGSGKSTLARALGKRLGVAVVHLDTLFWEPGWVEPDAAQFRERVRDALTTEAWVCEGNYARRTFGPAPAQRRPDHLAGYAATDLPETRHRA